MDAGRGQALEKEVLDYVDAAADQQDDVSGQRDAEIRVWPANPVPGHVVRPHGANAEVGQPLRDLALQPGATEVARLVVPVDAAAGPHQDDVTCGRTHSLRAGSTPQ